MERSEAEAKLIEYCEGQGYEVTVNWERYPVSLTLEEETSLFGQNPQVPDHIVLSVQKGQVRYCFYGRIKIAADVLEKIKKQFLAAFVQRMADYYYASAVYCAVPGDGEGANLPEISEG